MSNLTVDNKNLSEGERMKLLRTIEGDIDPDAVSMLPRPPVRVYACKDEVLGFADLTRVDSSEVPA